MNNKPPINSMNDLPSEVREALQRGNLFEAIKALRRAGVSNLKEAKAVLEAEARRINAGGQGRGHQGGGKAPAAATHRPPASGAFPHAATDALRRGQKSEAVRLVREHHGVGLKEAKALVEQHEQMIVPTVDSLTTRDGLSPGEVSRSSDRLVWWLVLAVIALGFVYHFVLRDPG